MDKAVMAIVVPLPAVLRTIREQIKNLTRPVLAILREEATCRRLMTVPGVGPITALAAQARPSMIRSAFRRPAPWAPITA